MPIEGISSLDKINFITDNKIEFNKTSNDGSGDVFFRMLNQVENSQKAADELSKDLLTGDVENLHQVTFAMEQAKLSLELVVQVRNKLVDAYQEIMRMQV